MDGLQTHALIIHFYTTSSSSLIMQLVKSHSAYNLPSFEPSCIEAELYLQYANQRKNDEDSTSKMRFAVQTSPYSVSPASSTGFLPVLRSHNVVVSNENIVDFLKLNFFDLDTVHEEALIEITALRKLLVDRLSLAHSYFEWVHFSDNEFARHADSVTRLLLRTNRKSQIEARLQGAGVTCPEVALKMAAETFQLLSLKLDTKRFYFGSNTTDVTSLDIASAAYVAVCLNANANSTSDFPFLPTLLKVSFPSLVEHSHRVLDAANIPDYSVTPDYSLYARAHKKVLLDCMRNNTVPPSDDASPIVSLKQSPKSSSIDDIDMDDDSAVNTNEEQAPVANTPEMDKNGEPIVPVKFKYSEFASISVMRAYREHIESNSLLGRMDRDEAEGKNPLWNIFTPLAIASMISFFAFAKMRK